MKSIEVYLTIFCLLTTGISGALLPSLLVSSIRVYLFVHMYILNNRF